MPEPLTPEPPDLTSVLLVLAHSEGGIGRHVRTVVSGLPRHRIRAVVCAPAPTLDALDLGGLDAESIPAPVGRFGPGALTRVRRAVQNAAGRVSIVHAHGLRAGAQSVAFGGATPLVVTWHNAPQGGPAARLGHAALARYVAGSTDLTLTASDDLARQARAAGATLVRNAFVAAPTLPRPTRDRTDLRIELGAGNRPVVLGIGRLHQQKRWDVLIDAAAGWSGDSAPYVVIAGEGPARADLAERIAATGAPVRLLGFRDDVAELLGAADVVALPSEWEARALVAQEALRAGVPLVTTGAGGVQSLVEGAATLVPVGDAGALRAAIEQVLADEDRRSLLVAAGRARAKLWPDESAALDELVANYRELLRRVSLR